MKLVFCKNEDLEISVFKEVSGNREEFSYIDMIKDLIATRELEASELEGEFSDAEINSINSMVDHINDEIAEFYSEDEE